MSLNNEAQVAMAATSGSAILSFLFEGGNGVVLGMAVCGSLVFVMNAEDMPRWKRCLYTPVSAFIGYVLSDDLLELSTVISRPGAAFVISAVCIIISTKAIQLINSGDIVKKLLHALISVVTRLDISDKNDKPKERNDNE